MTAEVEEKTEADWAVMYTEERKLRMKCQDRIASFMCNAPALACNAKELCFAAILAKEEDQDFMQMLVTVIKDANDLVSDINLNVMDPVWELTDQEQTAIANAGNWDDIPKSYAKRMSKIITTGARAMSEYWHDMCHERGFKCPAEIDHDSEEQFKELLLRRAMGDEKPPTKTH